MHFYPHNIADFNNSTRHLTRVERSVYRDAIERYYDTEQPLSSDFDALAKRLLCFSDEEKTALKTVLNEFFLKTEDGYLHERCEAEIEKYRTNTSAKAKAGQASAEARRKKRTDVQQTVNEIQLTNNQEPITNNQDKEEIYPATLNLEAWDAWLKYRQKMKFAKYKTDSKMLSLAQYPPEVQMRAVRNSIDNEYKGLFPENFVGGKHEKNSRNGQHLTPVQRVEADFAELERRQESMESGGADFRGSVVN